MATKKHCPPKAKAKPGRVAMAPKPPDPPPPQPGGGTRIPKNLPTARGKKRG